MVTNTSLTEEVLNKALETPINILAPTIIWVLDWADSTSSLVSLDVTVFVSVEFVIVLVEFVIVLVEFVSVFVELLVELDFW